MLLNKTAFKTNDIVRYFNCSGRTAKRYIADVRNYIDIFHKSQYVKYVSGDKSYRLLEKQDKI